MKKTIGFFMTLLMFIGAYQGLRFAINQPIVSQPDTQDPLIEEQVLAQEISNLSQDEMLDFSLTASEETLLTQLEEELTTMVSETAGDIGITYWDLVSGYSFNINGEQAFFAASTSKVPLVMEMTDLINQGLFSLEEEIFYQDEDYESGTGIIQGDIQESYSIETLMEYAIVYSDNIATQMLRRTLGDDYRNYYYETYLEGENSSIENILTSNDAATILAYLYNYRDTTGYETIIENMKETVFNNRLETATTTDFIAHKIGTYESNIHDIGLLDSQRPYILTVYTDNLIDGELFISEVSDSVWQIQSQLSKP